MKKHLFFLFTALFCAAAFAQDLPRIAVYVTGNVGDDEKKALGTRMLASLINSKRYKGIERSNSFLAEIEKEQEKQRSGAIDDGQISELGKQFGVKFVCIADITPVLGAFQISARIVDVETAEVAFIGESYSALKNVIDLVKVSDQVVKNMFGEEAKSTLAPKQEPKQEPEPKPAARKPTPQLEPAKPEPPPAAIANQTEPKPERIVSKPEKLTPEPKPEKPKPSNIPTTATLASRNYDRYFTLRYMPIAPPLYLSFPAHNVETGWVWRNGTSFGFDFALAVDFENFNWHSGGGFNLGKSFELAHDFNLALGGSLGFWYIGDDSGDYSDQYHYLFLGSFVRLRYSIFELSYRALFGAEVHYDNNTSSNSNPGLGVSNQVGIGLRFEGSNRFGQPRDYDDYFALRYLPAASPVYVSPIAYDIEYGWVLGNGMSMGIDFVAALGGGGDLHVGGGFNVGKSFELAHYFELVLGGSLGYWLWYDDPDHSDDDNMYETKGFNWIGPFVRLRYSIFELSYRALFGTEEHYDNSILGGSNSKPRIGVINQVGIGLYFEGKNIK